MARTLIQATINTLLSSGALQGQLDAYGTGDLVVADPINLNSFTATGRDLLVVYNDDTIAMSASLTNVAVTALTPGTSILGGVLSTSGQNLLTITAPNTFFSGQTVTFGTITGTASSFLSAQTVQVLSATSSQFTAVVGYALYASAANTGAVTSTPSTHYFVLHSAPDPNGRQATVGTTCQGQYTIAPGDYVQVWIPSTSLFQQTNGQIYLDADSAGIEFFLTH